MKIVEGMKRLKVIEKRMEDNSKRINEYASILSTDRPSFGSEDEQRKEVRCLIQANEDLVKEYLKLKQLIELTNLKVSMEIDGTKYTLSELLIIKRKLSKMMMNTYNSLNDQAAQRRLGLSFGRSSKDDKTPVIEKLYDERERINGLRKWQDLYDNIESRLEVLNATTDLIEG